MIGETQSTKLPSHRKQSLDCGKPIRNTGFLALALLVTCVVSSVAAADHPASIQRVGRLLGFGWGDGYHVCRDGGCRPGADLPPQGFPDQFGPKKTRGGWTGCSGCGKIYPAGTALTRPHVANCAGSCDAGSCDDPTAPYMIHDTEIDPPAATIAPPIPETPQETAALQETANEILDAAVVENDPRQAASPNDQLPRRIVPTQHEHQQLLTQPKTIRLPKVTSPAVSPSVHGNPFPHTSTGETSTGKTVERSHRLPTRLPARIATRPSAPQPSGWNPIRQPG